MPSIGRNETNASVGNRDLRSPLKKAYDLGRRGWMTEPRIRIKATTKFSALDWPTPEMLRAANRARVKAVRDMIPRW
jgi:hypothetical protein